MKNIGPSKVKLVKRHTHYPVPSNVNVVKELGKIMVIFGHTKGRGPESSRSHLMSA